MYTTVKGLKYIMEHRRFEWSYVLQGLLYLIPFGLGLLAPWLVGMIYTDKKDTDGSNRGGITQPAIGVDALDVIDSVGIKDTLRIQPSNK
jgi:hypothetical protein